MPVDIESELRALGRQYRAGVEPVSADEALGRATGAAPSDRAASRGSRRWLTTAAAGVFVVAGLVGIMNTQPAPTDDAPTLASPPDVAATPPTTFVVPEIRELDLADVAPVSIPMVISNHLSDVQLAVRAEVGDEVFGGAVANEPDTDDATVTIYGTDATLIGDVVDRIAADVRDRIELVESEYSVAALERFAAEARNRLDAAGIEAQVTTVWGLDAVAVGLITPDGEADGGIEAAARATLGDLPVLLEFSGPLVPLGGTSTDG